jgi:hypothetical protein
MSYSIATPQVTQNAGDRAYLTLQNQDACILWNEEGPEPMRSSGPRFSLVAIAFPKCV